MSLSKLQEIVKDREAWRDAVHGVTKSHRAIEQQKETPTSKHHETWRRRIIGGLFMTVKEGKEGRREGGERRREEEGEGRRDREAGREKKEKGKKEGRKGRRGWK